MIRTIDSSARTRFSSRTSALSPRESRAGLQAIHRILVLGRELASAGECTSALRHLLDAAESLPLMLLDPSEFEDLFPPILDGLAEEFKPMRGVRDEFLAAISDQ